MTTATQRYWMTREHPQEDARRTNDNYIEMLLERDGVIEIQRDIIAVAMAAHTLQPAEGKLQASAINDETHIAFTANGVTWRATVDTTEDATDEAIDDARLYARTSEALCAMDDAATHLERALQEFAAIMPIRLIHCIKRAHGELCRAGARQVAGFAVGPVTGFGGFVADAGVLLLPVSAACREGGAA